jgi:kinesin family protein 11
MQGDLGLSPLGNPVSNAGMMPRVLTNLFNLLNSTSSDFSVKISYVELYNEEMKDLLSSESSESSSTTSDRPASSLKIYDDASKKSVYIHGIEEIPVKDATAAIALLKMGSERRQVAATKFNDHSR